MTMKEFLTPATMKEIAEQSTANVIAQFDDFFNDEIDKLAIFANHAGLNVSPQLLEMTKMFIKLGFQTGAHNGSYSAVEILTRELVKAIKGEYQR